MNFTLNDSAVDFNLSDDLTRITVNSSPIVFELNAVTGSETDGNFRLLEDNDFRILENNDQRILE